MKKEITSKDYEVLMSSIGSLLEEGRKKAAVQVNDMIISTYWNIGKQIVEFEQKGSDKAEYGSRLLDRLSSDLKSRYGRGFSKSKIDYMRLLYIKYQKSEALSHQLSWSHINEAATNG